MASISILIVETEASLAEAIKNSLEGLGYAVTGIAGSGMEAIDKAAAIQPELVLLDICLKQQNDGIQIAKEIWYRFSIPVIFLTNRTDIDSLQSAKLVEAFGYITQPFREKDLQIAIEMAIYKHQLEKQLKDREQWLAAILTSIQDAVIAADEKSCITLLNPAAESLTGWKQEEALGKNITEVLHLVRTETYGLPENPFERFAIAGLNINLPERSLLINKFGTQIPVDNNTASISNEQGKTKGIVVIFRNITDRIETEKSRIAQAQAEKLTIQMAELERQNQLKDDFLNTVSHELRTPMANIRMAVKMLEISLERIGELATSPPQKEVGDRTAQRYLQILKDECNREIELIENILDLQRLEGEGQTFTPETIHLQTWLPQLVEPFCERAQSHQQSLQIDLPVDLPPIVSDRASVGRIVAELLHNACKYTPLGESIVLTLKTTAEKIQIQVCNTGIEIPPEALSHVFEKFYRIPSHDPWKQGGTGLGLALVQKLCEQLGGAIAAESRDKRTCFTVELPIVLS